MGEFNGPGGLTLYDNEVYVCDHNNHRIQIFDLNLNFVRKRREYYQHCSEQETKVPWMDSR